MAAAGFIVSLRRCDQASLISHQPVDKIPFLPACCRHRHVSACVQVQTFHISTMTVAQRSALANTWLTDTSGGSPDQTSGQNQQEQADDHSSDDNNSQGSMEAQKDLLETCELQHWARKSAWNGIVALLQHLPTCWDFSRLFSSLRLCTVGWHTCIPYV